MARDRFSISICSRNEGREKGGKERKRGRVGSVIWVKRCVCVFKDRLSHWFIEA